MERYLDPSWNEKFLGERKRHLQTGEVLSQQTSYAITKIEAVIEFQNTIVAELTALLEGYDEDSTINLVEVIEKNTYEKALAIVKGIKAPVKLPYKVKNAKLYFTK